MTKYAFVDGGFIDAMVRKTSEYFAIDLSRNKSITGQSLAGIKEPFTTMLCPPKRTMNLARNTNDE
ncbi:MULTISPECIES: hypothetical protein [unclassified Bradyrhizobium]|uniref:hypothetical protein n=1 Tax=unclassified Bradyrhizobium TaxID=2631580 RepID=UPI001FF7214E|nr:MULTISPECIES: hypothetical protein [unclassified Bradyrhizobium]MCK1525978.1 hypothetical protein [Bradyrhizobium sp. 17]MCK1687441.1 hypothetical protein [Bradyrhizobium sp. 145]